MANLPVNRNVNYINKDFSQFREKLINFSQTYFPNTYTDFSPESPGMMFIEQASYVGDVLSFYLDNQFQENFLQYARQSNNIYDLAYMFGYKPRTTSTSQTILDISQEIPAIFNGSEYVPDYTYALSIQENTEFSSLSGVSFITQDFVDFSLSSSQDPTSITISQILGSTPQYFLLEKQIKVISARVQSETFTFGNPIPFNTVNINSSNIIKVLDIIDSDGNKWYEVDHLGQEMVLDSIKNTNINDPNYENDVPYLLKLKKVPRRFCTRFSSQNNLIIQFGAGSPNDIDEEITPNANNVGLGLPFKKDKLTAAYSPVNFLYTGTYGIAPSNTTLTVRYLTGGGINSNIPANNITNIITPNKIKFSTPNLNQSTADYVFSTFSLTNLDPANGGKGGDTLEEIKQNTLALISSQKRSVTSDDYLIRALSMPSDYGSISKAYIEQPKLTDNQVSTIETLNLYILSLNSEGKLDYASNTLKNNLRTYLSQYRMIGDNIEIRDAFIINIGVNFEIIVLPEFNNNEVLLTCINALKTYFNINNWQLNQPILLRDLYVLLDKIKGVQTVKDIFIVNKAGTNQGYSQYTYDMTAATQNLVIYPSLDPSIFEIRYPDIDIKGRVVPL
jgi:hypothetical protein